MAIRKLQNLEAYVKEYLTHTVYRKNVRSLRRIRDRINKALDSNCCSNENDAEVVITGPTGNINSGASPYEVHITSNVEGVVDSDVDNIALYINSAFVTIQDGNDFDYVTNMTAQDPSVETVYYTVATLKSGKVIISPILQFTLLQNAPVWSFLQAQHIAQTQQTRHIMDVVVDVDPDNVIVSFIGLPSFCTASTINVFDMRGGRHAVLVDIVVTPGVGDIGTYNFTMRANDGVVNVDKAVSLVTNASAHQRFSVRPVSYFVNVTDEGGLQNLGTQIQSNAVVNGTQVWTEPADSTIGSIVFPNSTSLHTPTITPIVGVSSGVYVLIQQTRNTSTGTGGRYEDSIGYIINIT